MYACSNEAEGRNGWGEKGMKGKEEGRHGEPREIWREVDRGGSSGQGMDCASNGGNK